MNTRVPSNNSILIGGTAAIAKDGVEGVPTTLEVLIFGFMVYLVDRAIVAWPSACLMGLFQAPAIRSVSQQLKPVMRIFSRSSSCLSVKILCCW